MLAAAALVVTRSFPHEPNGELAATVAQHLHFDYSRSRTAEMDARAAQRQNDALLAVADDVLNAHIEVDSIDVRGPAFPAPLPQRAALCVRYRVMKGGRALATEERHLEFRRSAGGDWRYSRDLSAAFYWLYPL